MILTPWQNKVAEDTHRFRVLCCGRRAGKTVLAVEEMKGKAIADEVRIAYIATCYDKETEILTKEGWKYFKDLNGKEEVATLNGNKLHFELPKRYYYMIMMVKW